MLSGLKEGEREREILLNVARDEDKCGQIERDIFRWRERERGERGREGERSVNDKCPADGVKTGAQLERPPTNRVRD